MYKYYFSIIKIIFNDFYFIFDSATLQFHGFFDFIDNEPIMKHFCAFHINPIGQEPGAPTLPVK